MNSEPQALRPFLLLAIFFVVVGCATGFFLWWSARPAAPVGAPAAPGTPHPVPFPEGVPAAERERLTALVATLVAGRKGAEKDLIVAGRAALPPLLDALYRLTVDPGFDDPRAREILSHLDPVMVALRARLTPGAPPMKGPGPWTDGPPIMSRNRVAEWFRWWEEEAGPSGG